METVRDFIVGLPDNIWFYIVILVILGWLYWFIMNLILAFFRTGTASFDEVKSLDGITHDIKVKIYSRWRIALGIVSTIAFEVILLEITVVLRWYWGGVDSVLRPDFYIWALITAILFMLVSILSYSWLSRSVRRY